MLVSCAEKKNDDFQMREGSCSGTVQEGVWGNGADTLYISGDCRGAITRCEIEFTYIAPFFLDYGTIVDVSSSNNGKNCMSVGIHSCNMTVYNSDSTLQLMCDAIPESYYNRK